MTCASVAVTLQPYNQPLHAHCFLQLPPCVLRLAMQAMRLTGNPLAYFSSGWQAMDFASTCLLVAWCDLHGV